MTDHRATRTNGAAGYLPAAFASLLFALFAAQVPRIGAGEVLLWSADWLPSLGISFAMALDGLSLTFSLLISGIGALVLLYSNSYLAGHPHWTRFALFLTSFMLAMLGLVLADDLISLFVFWELTTITSYLLIGFGHETETGRRSALQALLVTGAGALAMLAGLILLGNAAGTFRISAINGMGEAIRAHPMYLPILILVLAGAFTKSAQVPFHFWLPNAMAAPTPVSAFLHSATMVKGGVYLLARLHPALSGTEIWVWTLTLFGAATAVFASVLALRQTDLKLALAYTTLMALGTLTMTLAQPGAYALTGFATFLVAHSLYKASLFLMVGCVDHGTGTREADRLGGLARAMPVSALAAALAALSMAGLPPLIGFIAKELQYAGAIAAEGPRLVILAAALAANALMFAVAGVVALRPFFGRTEGEAPPQAAHEAPWQMLAGPLLLAALGLAFGLAPWLIEGSLVGPVVAGFLGDAGEARPLHLWAGVNLPLLLSLTTFALGIALYLGHRPLRRALARADAASPSFDRGWDRVLDGVKALAAGQTRIVQPGRLRSYLFVTFAVVAAGLGGALLHAMPALAPISLEGIRPKSFAILVLIVAGAMLTAMTRSRIAAVAGLGVVGIGVALIFIIFSAPDVAITQLLVEVLVVVLVAVAMLRLPYLDDHGRRERRPWDAVLALLVGAAVSLVTLAVLAAPMDRRLTAFFEAAAWPEAYGRNIVNVILVDFRALDTFGEIAVVAVAALAARALLRTTRASQRRDAP